MQEALPGLQQPATPQYTMANEASLVALDMEDANESEEEAEGTSASTGLPTRFLLFGTKDYAVTYFQAHGQSQEWLIFLIRALPASSILPPWMQKFKRHASHLCPELLDDLPLRICSK